MRPIKALVLRAFVTAALAGCGYSASRTVTSNGYIPPKETTTATYSPAYAPANSPTSQVVTTVTRNSDGQRYEYFNQILLSASSTNILCPTTRR